MVYHFLTGSYAAPEDVGVCRFSFDPAQGFSLQKGWENFINPSFLLKHPHHPVLYTVEETTPEGTVRAWELQGALLRPLGALPTGGGSPCHLALSQDGMQLYVSNYVSGSLAVFALNAQGNLSAMTDLKRHSGQGPNAYRQEGPHVHCALEQDGLLRVCDLGTDRIEFYQVRNGKLTEAGGVALKPGSGPRHLAVHPKLPGQMYCVAELESSVYRLAQRQDAFEIVQSLSALPDDFSGENTGAALHFSGDGKLLLSSNRGHDSIAVFPVDGDGKLGRPVISPCVAEPRDFAVYDDYVIVGSQRKNEIRAYRLDRDTLRLTDTGFFAETDCPTCFFRVN